MSFLMILRIALKALGRNKMRTALTMLGMIIGVAAVITMVALGTGAQSVDRGADPVGRHEHGHGLRPATSSQGGVRLGQGNASTLDAGGCGRDRAGAGRPVRRRRVEHARPGRRREPELEHADPGHRRGPAASSGRGRCSEGAFFTPQDVATASKVAVLGTVDARSAVSARRESGRRGDPHRQPAVHRRRRDVEQGAVGDGLRTRTTRSSCRSRP